MSDELKPCPFCGSKNLEVREIPFVGHTVRCWNGKCMASGPVRDDQHEAIRAWNDKLDEENNNDK